MLVCECLGLCGNCEILTRNLVRVEVVNIRNNATSNGRYKSIALNKEKRKDAQTMVYKFIEFVRSTL